MVVDVDCVCPCGAEARGAGPSRFERKMTMTKHEARRDRCTPSDLRLLTWARCSLFFILSAKSRVVLTDNYGIMQCNYNTSRCPEWWNNHACYVGIL